MRSAVGKLIIVMLATVLIAQTCNAQVSGSSGSGGGRKGHQQKADKPTASAPKANDKAYNAALKSLPDKPFDPWRGALLINMRSSRTVCTTGAILSIDGAVPLRRSTKRISGSSRDPLSMARCCIASAPISKNASA
jgi:hypothetical protein